jgi:peptidoglycan/LPS O-acetylase OafA/YrhL
MMSSAGGKMNDNKTHWHPLTYLLAFLIGVILLWSFGKDSLDLQSASVFLAGLIGVALAVLAFGVWNIYYDSHHKEN